MSIVPLAGLRRIVVSGTVNDASTQRPTFILEAGWRGPRVLNGLVTVLTLGESNGGREGSRSAHPFFEIAPCQKIREPVFVVNLLQGTVNAP